MTREELSAKIRWPRMMFWLGILNPIGLLPQLSKIVVDKNVEGVSLMTFALFLIIQVSFTINGYFQRDKAVMVSMGSSVLITTTIIFFILRYQ